MGAIPRAKIYALVEILVRLPNAAAGKAINLICGFNFLFEGVPEATSLLTLWDQGTGRVKKSMAQTGAG